MLNNKAIARNIIIDRYSFKKSNSIQFIYISFGIIKEEDRSHKRTKMAGVTGLEPAASCVTGRRSNQLSYTPHFWWAVKDSNL